MKFIRFQPNKSIGPFVTGHKLVYIHLATPNPKRESMVVWIKKIVIAKSDMGKKRIQ